MLIKMFIFIYFTASKITFNPGVDRKLASITTFVIALFAISPAWGATYYASHSGSGTACSLQNPCTLLYAVETKAERGDTVIARGGTYHMGTVTISENGLTLQNYAGEIPIIDGDKARPGDWNPLIHINADGVTVDGFSVRESQGRGIYVSTGNDDANIRNCTVHNTYRHGILFEGADGGTIEDCVVHDTSLNNANAAAQGTHQWSGGIAGKNVNDFVVRRCIVYNSWGEGVSTFGKGGNTPDNVLFEYNTIYNNWAVELYVNGSTNVTIRYNIIYGLKDRTFWRSGKPSAGIIINDEDLPFACNNISVYGNFLAYNGNNIGFWNSMYARYGEPTPYSDIYIYNNTSVEAYSNAVHFTTPVLGKNVRIKNNIFWEPSGGLVGKIPSATDFDYNLWSAQPSDPDARGNHDVFHTDPKLLKSSGWSSLLGGSLKGPEFNLKEDSPAIDTGATLDARFSSILDCEQSDWGEKKFSIITQNDHGFGWEIGADIHSVDKVFSSELNSPKNLRVLHSATK